MKSSLLPNKYVSYSASTLGISEYIYGLIGSNETVSTLWEQAKFDSNVRTFERFSEALTLLYASNLIEFYGGIIQIAELNKGQQ